jgi:hypothetical protein
MNSSVTEIVFKVTVPTAEAPLVTDAGTIVSDAIPGGGGTGMIFNNAVLSLPLKVALILTVTGAITVLVKISKLTEVAPAGTPTLSGKINISFRSADRGMVTPPAGAAVFIVIVPTAAVPLVTESGATINDDIVSGGVG